MAAHHPIMLFLVDKIVSRPNVLRRIILCLQFDIDKRFKQMNGNML